MSDIYESLAKHLDNLPGGFPATGSRIEMRLLKRLFSPEEARIALATIMAPEPVESIAARLGEPPDELAPKLYEMSRKGLLFRSTKNNRYFYMTAQFVVGIWEYHVNDLDEGLIRDFNEYVPHLARNWNRQKTKQLRVIPVSRSISAEMSVMPYEAAEQIIAQQSRITVAPCICRKEHRMVGNGCDNPLEVCLVFGSGAVFYEENGLGRSISKEEALAVLKMGMEAGLVLQPSNSQKAMNICMCCGCCCQILKNLKTLPKPAEAVVSNYRAQVQTEECIGCGVCVDRCHMQAITIDETAVVNPDRCIGCGVCVSFCDTKALSLVPKPGETYIPPKTTYDTFFTIARERGIV